MTSQRVTRYALRAPGGVHLPCCGSACLAALAGTEAFGDYTAAAGVRAGRSCAHCSWCGTLVATPERCALHAACPGFRWDVTEAARQAVGEVRARVHGAWLTPRALTAFAEVAHQLHAASRFPDAAALVAGVLDRKVDWLP